MPKISDAEWEVLNIIWNNPKISAANIEIILGKKEIWKFSTIKTLINRLLKKEVISYEKAGKEYLYYAVIEKDKCIVEESKTFIDKVFGGSINSMLLNFVKSEKLTNEEIKDLRDLLDKELEER
ncbi:MAG: BlaI/MecI/CopY family transcriptional regulator [Sarcina sp.]